MYGTALLFGFFFAGSERLNNRLQRWQMTDPMPEPWYGITRKIEGWQIKLEPNVATGCTPMVWYSGLTGIASGDTVSTNQSYFQEKLGTSEHLQS